MNDPTDFHLNDNTRLITTPSPTGSDDDEINIDLIGSKSIFDTINEDFSQVLNTTETPSRIQIVSSLTSEKKPRKRFINETDQKGKIKRITYNKESLTPEDYRMINLVNSPTPLQVYERKQHERTERTKDPKFDKSVYYSIIPRVNQWIIENHIMGTNRYKVSNALCRSWITQIATNSLQFFIHPQTGRTVKVPVMDQPDGMEIGLLNLSNDVKSDRDVNKRKRKAPRHIPEVFEHPQIVQNYQTPVVAPTSSINNTRTEPAIKGTAVIVDHAGLGYPKPPVGYELVRMK